MFKKLNLLLIGLLFSSFIHTNEQENSLGMRIEKPTKSKPINQSHKLIARLMRLFSPKPSPEKAFESVENCKLDNLAAYINNGGDVNIKDEYGYSLLSTAIFYCHKNIVDYLIAQPNIKIDQQTAIDAVERRYLEIFRKFIDNGGDINTKNKHGQSLLSNSINTCDQTMTDYLLAQPNIKIDQDIAVEAAREGRLDVIHKFINNGGDVNTKNKYGESLLSIAIYRGYKDIIDYLLAQPSINIDQEIAPVAARQGYLDFIRKFINNNGNVNTKDVFGQSLLFIAIYNHRKDIIDYLLAQPNLKIDQEIAMVAAVEGNLDVIHKFINNGGDINTKNQFGDSLLTSAIYNHHKEIVDYLLAHSNINIDQKTAMEATREGRLDIIHKFINNGGDMNTKNQFGSSLLSNAIACGNKDIVDYLLAQPSINIDQKIAFLAARRGLLEAVRKFIDNGGDVNTKNKNGNSLLSIALLNYNENIATYLLNNPNIDVKYLEGSLSIAGRNKDYIDKILRTQSNKDPELLLERSKKYAEIIDLIKQKISAAQ